MIKKTVDAARQVLERVRTARAYQRLFATEDGRVVLRDLMAKHYMTRSAATLDSNELFHREGQRFVVLSLCRELHLDTEALAKQMEEEIHE